jgi:AraC family transcriptional regulator
MAVEIDPERARSFLHDDARAIDPTTRLSARDPVLERLFACMRSEVDTGCASGRLFAEGLSLSLLARLAACYGAAGSTPDRPARKLSSQQLQQTVEFIDAHIGADLSVATLAGQLDMSPYTFSKLFKAKVESSPHSFVLSRRIQRAELMLGGPLALSEIALSVGFASQSHFTEAFRRRTGRTPSKARRRD